jgi:hypothetical protein
MSKLQSTAVLLTVCIHSTCSCATWNSGWILLLYVLLISVAEMVVGSARSHYLSSAVNPSIKGDRLTIPRER